MAAKKVVSHQSYVLHCSQESPASLDQPFVLEDSSGEQLQHVFSNFNQVMNFVLDQLLEESDGSDEEDEKE